jgi:hypothetical protein
VFKQPGYAALTLLGVGATATAKRHPRGPAKSQVLYLRDSRPRSPRRMFRATFQPGYPRVCAVSLRRDPDIVNRGLPDSFFRVPFEDLQQFWPCHRPENGLLCDRSIKLVHLHIPYDC